jgi:hypothetical protein
VIEEDRVRVSTENVQEYEEQDDNGDESDNDDSEQLILDGPLFGYIDLGEPQTMGDVWAATTKEPLPAHCLPMLFSRRIMGVTWQDTWPRNRVWQGHLMCRDWEGSRIT